jgi:pimeloyl-ACP methyl ester carboxylesterase
MSRVRSGFAIGRDDRGRPAQSAAAARRRRSWPARLEVLEERTLLSNIVVNSTEGVLFQAPTATTSTLRGNTISLRDAINIANNTPCPNTIVLQSGMTYQLTLIDNDWYGPNGLPAISSNITIQGNGATIERNSNMLFRFFYISNQQYGSLPSGSLTLDDLTLENGYAYGGESYSGGGGLGAGGAIFNQGTLALSDVTFSNNTAYGGDAGTYASTVVGYPALGAGIGEDASANIPGGFGAPLPGATKSFQRGGSSREGQGGTATKVAGFGGGGATGNAGDFGGGGGLGSGSSVAGGFGGGDGGIYYVGAGAGMGGAIFNRGGSVSITGSTFTDNLAQGGSTGSSYYGPAGAGSAYGGAIFNFASTKISPGNNTFQGNRVKAGSGANGMMSGPDVYNYVSGRHKQPVSKRHGVPVRVARHTDKISNLGGRLDDTVRPEYPLLNRLAEYDSASGYFLPVAPHSITNSKTTADNVYVIVHGWMPGDVDWVNELLGGALPGSWQTWQGPVRADGPSTPWLYQGSSTDAVLHTFPISVSGLAQQIMKVDHNATVLAYSWIDDSATEQTLKIPQDAYHSEAYTTMNGMRMAEAIMDALAPSYYRGLGKVHLIGHSHGARVATVAALALQQAALNPSDPQDPRPQFDVVGQLTLLDSPEDTGAGHISPLNPINLDAANFDWFYLSQLHTTPAPNALTGTVANGQSTVSGVNTTSLFAGMGVTGPGVPAGTTILKFGQTPGQIILSAPVTIASKTPKPITLGFWNWNDDAIFVDSYVSYFGSDYDGFVVNNSGETVIPGSLANVVNVDLDPYYVFHPDPDDVAAKHEYAANWYAGTASPPSTPKGVRVGLLWSPLISGASLPPGRASQNWSSVSPAQQYILTPESSATSVVPMFNPLTLAAEQPNCCQGHVMTEGTADDITAVTLEDNSPTMAVFNGDFDKETGWEGISFNYSFTGGDDTDGAQLQIWLNGRLYFAMTGSVAESGILPGSGQLSATFGVGREWSHVGADTVQIRLVPSQYASGTPTTVTVSNFHYFTL